MYLGVITADQARFNALWALTGAKTVPFPNGGGSVAPIATPIVSRPPSIAPISQIRVAGPVTYAPAPAPVRTPLPTPILPGPPRLAPIDSVPAAANAGTPVPAGFPTNQIFVNSDGSFWEYGTNGWVNVGTPYNTGASATPAAPAPSPSGGSTAPPAGTTAPGPVSLAPAATGTYHEILDWLQQDSLGSSIGFSGIPNWIVAGGVVLLGYKLTQKSGGRH